MSRRPLFLLSLPRSGSTLVQRILAGHEEIATAPEPWILLPQIYAMREQGLYAEYGQVPASRAIREFAERLPGGPDDYRTELRSFVSALYDRASDGGGGYFLDKTPRYHHIADDLFDLFPEGRFLFLWRNPLAVAASISETWGRGRWNVEKYRTDLFDGTAHLVSSYRAHADRSIALRFEDLVTHPLETWPSVFAHLDLSFDPELLRSFGEVRLDARMGDPTGSRAYTSLSVEPLDKWRRTLANPIRKRWCHGYLRWIGQDRLQTMGYDLAELEAELDSLPSSPRGLVSDVATVAYGRTSRLRRRASAASLWGDGH
ncbi:MAG: sulfotransferase [Actinomycetota bacterium]